MDQPELKAGYIFDIQGFSVHDGPGCRTLIFMKGCTLDCAWCSNPEGIHPFPEPLWRKSRCTFDRLCVDVCPYNAIRFSRDELRFDRQLCQSCSTHDCAAVCMSGALSIAGQFISTNELMQIVRRDRQYWGTGGGITLTGGEPFLQADFAKDLLEKCYTAYIHTAAETCGNYPWNNIEDSLPFLDWIFFDLKQVTNITDMILSNALRLSKEFQGRLIFRLPLIPGMTDDKENLCNIRDFVLQTGRKELNILPGHHLGREKHLMLGNIYYTRDFSIVSPDTLVTVQNFFQNAGITCYTGSQTPF